MAEIAINTPFEANEAKDILCAEFRKRLDGLTPLQGAKEYARFEATFNVGIKVWRVGESGGGKETLAWGNVNTLEPALVDTEPEAAEVTASDFKSKDPNEERVARDMPLTVETNDGKGGKVRRKVRVKN